MLKRSLGFSSLAAVCVMALLSPLRAADPVKVRVGISPVLSSAPVFLAYEKGYYRDEGLDVELVPFTKSGSAMLPQLATGELDVGGGNLGASFYNAQAKGINLKVVADKGSNTPGSGYLTLVARQGLTVKGPADLKGKTFSFTGPGVSQEIVADRWLRTGGLTIKDVTVVNMAYEDANPAMAGGRVDATVQIEPLLTAALTQGMATAIKGAQEIYPNQQSAAMFYGEKFSAEKPEAAKAFMVAYLKGVRDYNRAFVQKKDPDSEVAMLMKHTPTDSPEVMRNARPVGLSPDGRLNLTSMQADLDWYAEMGYVQVKPDLNKLVDHSYVDAAAAKLGGKP